MKKLTRYMKFLFLFAPFIIGTIGLLLANYRIDDAMYASLQMYSMDYGEGAPNFLCEIGRWSAPVVVAGGLLMAVSSTVRRLMAHVRYHLLRTVAVYGDEEHAQVLRSELGHKAVKGKEELVPSHVYVLLKDEDWNLSFYQEHRKELAKQQVYLMCRSLHTMGPQEANLHLFSPEEIGARAYWKQSRLYEAYRDLRKNEETETGNVPVMKLAIVGLEELGSQILYWGLQHNIFAPDQHIEYHIFGDQAHFEDLHTQLSKLGDRVIFHEKSWQSETRLLADCHRIILTGQKNQLETLRDILFSTTQVPIDVLVSSALQISLVEDPDRCHFFDWRGAAYTPASLFDESTLKRAKAIHLHYAHSYDHVEESPAEAEKQWQKLNVFTRHSNISSADYHEVRLQMMADWGVGSDGTGLTYVQKDLLAQLEHIRWCRFHYLNNWQYHDPIDGERKTPALRFHSDLVPYESLTEEEKKKDHKTIDVMLKVG